MMLETKGEINNGVNERNNETARAKYSLVSFFAVHSEKTSNIIVIFQVLRERISGGICDDDVSNDTNTMNIASLQ